MAQKERGEASQGRWSNTDQWGNYAGQLIGIYAKKGSSKETAQWTSAIYSAWWPNHEGGQGKVTILLVALFESQVDEDSLRLILTASGQGRWGLLISPKGEVGQGNFPMDLPAEEIRFVQSSAIHHHAWTNWWLIEFHPRTKTLMAEGQEHKAGSDTWLLTTYHSRIHVHVCGR